jgi:hypothetical protein
LASSFWLLTFGTAAFFAPASAGVAQSAANNTITKLRMVDFLSYRKLRCANLSVQQEMAAVANDRGKNGTPTPNCWTEPQPFILRGCRRIRLRQNRWIDRELQLLD